MPDMNITNNQAGYSATTEITSRAAVTVIILMFMIVVFVFFLHLYTKRFWWRGGEQNRVLSNGPAAARTALSSSGLDQTILKALPVLVFTLEEFEDGLECSVCLSEVVDGEQTRLLPKCNHGFHVECIDMWFQSHSTCPLCRNPVSLPLQSSESEARVIDITNTSLSSLQIPGSSSESSNSPYLNEEPSAESLIVDEEGPSHMVIDIPMETTAATFSRVDRYDWEEETKAPPVLTRMQTFKRLLSRENRVADCSSASADVELTAARA